MNKERKFQERILANLNAELMYCIAKGDKEQQELLEMRIKKQKKFIYESILADKSNKN